jgi:predicted component of type VI protein secretion system
MKEYAESVDPRLLVKEEMECFSPASVETEGRLRVSSGMESLRMPVMDAHALQRSTFAPRELCRERDSRVETLFES